MSDGDVGTGTTAPDAVAAIAAQLVDLNTRLTSLERAPWQDVVTSGSTFATGDVVGSFAATRAGFLLMDGSAIADATWPGLCAYIRVNLPALVIDGSNVHLPDARGNVLPGADGATFVLGATVGAQTVTLTGLQSGVAAHSHTMPAATGGPSVASTGAGTAHSHPSPGNPFVIAAGGGGQGFTTGSLTTSTTANTGNESAHTHSLQAHTHTLPDTDISGPTNAASAHTNIQPSLPINWFIKT